MTLKLKKCHFFWDSIDYLGHVTTSGKQQVACKTTMAISALHYQIAVSRMRSSMDPCYVYRRFVSGFARIVLH